jgi:acyl-CoA reductase-like NAD-dependent aldehyde dehydrogenase
MDIVNPATEKVWASVPAADAVDVDRAVSTARQAFRNPEWRDLSLMVRAELLHRLADRVKQEVPSTSTLR